MLIKKNNKIDAIIFDLVGVLLIKRKNYKPDKIIDEIDCLIGDVTNNLVFKNEVLKKYNLNEKKFETILYKITKKYEPSKQLYKMLPPLKKFYKLAIINNGTSLTYQEFDKKLNFSKNFDLFVCSAIEGTKKPDKKIYLETADRLRVKPKNCLFIDDNTANISGARQIGMKTVLWKNSDSNLKNFKKLFFDI